MNQRHFFRDPVTLDTLLGCSGPGGPVQLHATLRASDFEAGRRASDIHSRRN